MATEEYVPETEEAEEDVYQPKGNVLALWGNKETMNLNNMIITNIIQSPYFKNQLFELKTYHEVIDEIYYKVQHLEPWERGSRRTGGQTGMCGGVRGVGAGGIVSTAFCLLYKLYTLKLTRKQLRGLLDHCDSPYIRGLGFMFIRYCINPQDFWHWFAPYLDDPEEIDVKAGGGCSITIGEMVLQFLTKLDWFSTLFPRIPVPVQKKLEEKLRERSLQKQADMELERQEAVEEEVVEEPRGHPREREEPRGHARERDEPRGHARERDEPRGHARDWEEPHREREGDRHRDRRGRDGGDRRHRSRSRSRDRHRRHRSRSRSREHRRARDQHREDSFERDLRRERKRQTHHYK